MKDKIIFLLPDSNQAVVEKFASYCERLALEKKQDGSFKNPFMQKMSPEKLAELFKRVNNEGLEFDGKHVSLQSTGISYDYVAYKNKMLIAYPESQITIEIVKEGDIFNFTNEDGKITYKHEIKDPFVTADEKTIIGAYCVIKNKRGDFLTVLSKEDIEKHRKVAKGDFIWKQWFKEMTLKTVIKKACKYHFDDMYKTIEEVDNETINLENPIDLELQYKMDIDAIETVEDLAKYYHENKGKGKDFDKYVMMRKIALQENDNTQI